MSRILMCLLGCTLSFAAYAQQASITRISNLRSGPYTTSRVLRTLAAGTSITVISKYPKLGYVRVHDASGDNTGWMLERNLSAASSLEIAAEAALPHSLDHLAGDGSIYPNFHSTPGKADPTVTQANIAKNICNKNWTTDSVRPATSVTNKIKRETMATYGFTDAANHYELDHLLSLQNGGCPDCVENLWPQAYGDSRHPMTQNERHAWNREHPDTTTILAGSLEKDVVENHIHDEICFGIPNAKASSYAKKYPATVTVTLKRGQQILATDWFACYQKMMDGNKPCL
jgi:uncharacterized protein YraI